MSFSAWLWDPDLEVRIGGPDSGIHGRSVSVVQNGRTINGPVVGLNEAVQLTLSSAADFSALRIPGQGSIASRAGDEAPLSTFTTVGARHPLSPPEAEHFLKGALREVLIYNRPLTAANQGLIEDYQMSRWQQIRVWNYRNATLPVKITGAAGVSHSISGGEGNDELSGGDQADILRGGMGSNRLTGKAGADRFRFSKTGSNDVIADFSASTGDSIDLTELFAGMSGLPGRQLAEFKIFQRQQKPAALVQCCGVFGMKAQGSGKVDLDRSDHNGKIMAFCESCNQGGLRKPDLSVGR